MSKSNKKAQLSLRNPRDAIENCWFYQPLPCFTPPGDGTPLDIRYRRNLYTAEKCIQWATIPSLTLYPYLLPFLRNWRLKVENCRFQQPLPCLTPPSGGTPLDIDAIYTPLKSAFNGLQFRRWHYRSIFIRLAVVASQSREITRNSDKIWPYTSSRHPRSSILVSTESPYMTSY